ncbi:hypothetical protein [Granulicella sp. L60]|uniref:hypothetical protein n=1 Tax=Granulicella sp. L60 TaxID=1641866 RepID=UPI0020B144F7|nr:hypothetical protein [Granulicella sp. L60]
MIDHDGAVLPAVPFEVTLPVSVQIETPRNNPAGDGAFPNTCTHNLPLPLDVARKTYVY